MSVNGRGFFLIWWHFVEKQKGLSPEVVYATLGTVPLLKYMVI